MADVSNVLDQAHTLIEDRIKELKDELKRLERALTDLKGPRRGPGRPRTNAAPKAAPTRRRRRRKGGTRADQTMKLVQESPGITASEIAAKLKIKPNYVYRVMAGLQDEGHVVKKGRGYHPTGK